MSILSAIYLLAQRELILKQRKPAEWLNPLLFFILIASLFPLATTADPSNLRMMAAGVVWVAVMLATLLSMPSLFQYDYSDGSLEQLLLCPQPLPLLVGIKILVHWLFGVVPLILATPLLGLMYGLNGPAILMLLLTLLLGTPTLMLLAALVASLIVSLPQGGFLLALILLPMCLPLLIFASSAVSAAAIGLSVTLPLALLGAFLLLAFTLVPLVIAYSLRIGMGFY